MKARAAIVLALASTVAGCATQSNLVWHKPGASQQEFYQAKAQCSSMSGPGGQQITPVYGTGFPAGFMQGYNQAAAIQAQQQRQQIYNYCMMGHGYSLMSKRQARNMQANANNAQVDAFWRSLEQQVPNFREINSDPQFLDWLEGTDTITGQQRQTLLTAAQNRHDADAVAAMFRQFQQMQ